MGRRRRGRSLRSSSNNTNNTNNNSNNNNKHHHSVGASQPVSFSGEWRARRDASTHSVGVCE